ncbi:glycerol-3-phosphate 1-O-acyltransferase PlsY [Candidatus Raskinella chloraquaticus]|jgi:acyl phosphate:glycerol-3-phosphate acyltransferase|uniref:Glycerol-3-phosphate acyltransferase n=1 Tax=Candidatus Raskinella chloraquaticus TaxID=1951219 RepID=A0A1W9I4B1_9HYPH|nr:MAG: glycerol-3-phosphate acyltransferase [Proteobacteria bacterium SG_bin8]
MAEFFTSTMTLQGAMIALAFGYLLGSIPFGIIITRFAGAGDLRQIGSGNIGATNVLRTGRKGLAALTLLGDLLKGTAASALAANWSSDAGLIAGAGAFLGHLYPVWLRFRGGKGVATFLGVLLGTAWPVAIAFAAIWLSVAWLTRYSSLSALIAAASAPLIALGLAFPREAVLYLLLAACLGWRHRDNIARLRSGTESRIGSQ